MEDDSQNQDQRTPFVIPDSSFAREELLAELDRLNRRLARRDFELIQMKEQREREVLELKKVKAQLEEAKGVLEIKVNAKTRNCVILRPTWNSRSKKGRASCRRKSMNRKIRACLDEHARRHGGSSGAGSGGKGKTLAIITILSTA